MKKQLAISLAATLCFAGASVLAGDEGQGEKPQMFCIYKEIVAPGKTRQYEDAIKYMISEFKEYQIDPEKIHFTTISGPEIGYIYVTPIENFAGMDTMRANWDEAVSIFGKDKFEAMIAPAEEAIEKVHVFHSIHRTDLSYEPANPRLKPEEVKYIHYGFYYAIPGKEKEFEAIATEFAELYKKNGIDTGWNIYQAITGSDLPMMVVAQGAKSEVDYYTNRARIKEVLGEEAEKIGEKVGTTVRKMEHRDGYLRPELSYPGPDHATPYDED